MLARSGRHYLDPSARYIAQLYNEPRTRSVFRVDLDIPHKSLGMGATGDLLAVLATLRTPLSGRRIADDAGVSASQASNVLRRLTEDGLVTARTAGSSILYELNRDHVLAPAVELIVGANSEWRRRVIDEVNEWELRPDAVMLFGSLAAGTSAPARDIDLLVLRPDNVAADDETWTTQLADLATSVRRWTGNSVDLLDVDQAELNANERLQRDLRRHGIALVGRWPQPGRASA